jgi:hypothetical protein
MWPQILFCLISSSQSQPPPILSCPNYINNADDVSVIDTWRQSIGVAKALAIDGARRFAIG